MLHDLLRIPADGIELRLPDVQSAPELPQAPYEGEEQARVGRDTRRGQVEPKVWTAVRQEAQRRGISPVAVLVTAYADVLGLWSKQADFTLDLADSGQDAALCLTVDNLPSRSFAARAEQLHEQLARAAEGQEQVRQSARCRLNLCISEEDGGLALVWDAPEAEFPDGLTGDIAAVCLAILRRLADGTDAWDSDERLADLPEWQRAERESANTTGADLPVTTLCRLVETRAAERPDAVAVIAEDGRLTYLETVAAARRLARRLIALGAIPGSLVGVVVDKGLAQVPALLGVTLSGAAYLPVDPQWPAARRAQILAQGGVHTVVTTSRLRDEEAWPAGVRLVTLDDADVQQESAEPLPTGPAPEDLAYVIFTSGSTGQPKGVMIDHRGAANTVQDINQRFGIGPDDRVLALSSLSFDLSVYDVFGTLAAGGTVITPAPNRAHDPEHWSDLVSDHGVTVWNSVPALMRLWLDAPTVAPAPSLRVVMLSGDWIPVTLPDAIRSTHPNAQVMSLGGATEASIWSVTYPIADVPPHWSRIPYGKPLANQTLHVLDHRLEPRPVWSTGEIYIGGVGVAKGYWADPTRTAERFIVHPVSGEYLYRTGDLGRYLPGGDIEFLGREDTQVKLNGFRIELDEIAAVLRRQPGVGEAILTVGTNPATGRGQLVAHVLPDEQTAAAPVADTATVWAETLEAGMRELRRVTDDLAPAITTFRDLWHRLESLAPSVMARNLARLGALQSAGDTTTADEIIDRCGVRPLYRGLLTQWMSVLVGEGLLSATGRPGEYRAERGLDANELDGSIKAALAAGTASGSDRVLLDYFTACIDHQIALLRGEIRPLQLLLPDGDWKVTRALYSANPAAELQNRTAASIVRSYVEQFPTDRQVRILELGAGTGAICDRLLPTLPAERVRYHFTDISTAFTTAAKERYQDAYPFVSYGLFNIDDDPAPQGLAAGSADVIVGANVLHDAKDLGATLEAVRGLLAPGGVLVLVEGTVNSPLNMISFAFLEAFGNYQDQREATLLSVPQWQEQLERAGFTRVAPVPDGGPAIDALVQHVLMAGAPSGAESLDPAALNKALSALLPDYMVPHHYLVLDALPLSANGKVDRAALPMPWRESAPTDRTSPRTALEQRLFAIWVESLGRDDFGTEDNFFDLGGDSLHAVRIIAKLRTELGIQQAGDEAVDMLFQAPTIAELAEVLAAQPEAGR